MVREGERTYTINYGTDLDDLGESRLIYIQNKNTVLSLADSGKNIKEETTAKERLSDVLGRAGISQSDAESYVNFGQTQNWYSDWRIRYEITIKGVSGDYPDDLVERGRNDGFILPDYSAALYKSYDAAADTLVYSVDFRIGEAKVVAAGQSEAIAYSA